MIRDPQAESIAEEEGQHEPAGDLSDLHALRSSAIRFPAGLAARHSFFWNVLGPLPQVEDRIPTPVCQR